VNGHDRLRPFRDAPLGGHRVEVEALVNVGDNRNRAAFEDRLDTCDEGERGCDDLVAGPIPMARSAT
jgi:hypothetical protein